MEGKTKRYRETGDKWRIKRQVTGGKMDGKMGEGRRARGTFQRAENAL